MHFVSSVSIVVRTCKDASVQVDQRVLFCFLPGNKTIVSDAKSITHCEIFALKFKRHYDDIQIENKQTINQLSNI